MIDQRVEASEIRPDHQRYLILASPVFEGFPNSSRIIVVSDCEQMRRRNRQHIPNNAVDMFVAEAVTVGYENAIRAANRGGEVAKQLDVRIFGGLSVILYIFVTSLVLFSLYYNVPLQQF